MNKDQIKKEIKKAYYEIGGGRGFVRIYQIRGLVNTDFEKFNQALDELARDLIICCHQSDPSFLTQQQLQNSFRFEDDPYYYITISFQ